MAATVYVTDRLQGFFVGTEENWSEASEEFDEQDGATISLAVASLLIGNT